ncbi:MAG TPA: mechanosensitive ion channel domain-containing protein, partial [Longimicrobiales bacterium]
MDFFGVQLIGLTAESGRKLLLTIGVLLVLWLIGRLLRVGLRAVFGGRRDVAASFWSRQAVHIVLTLLFVVIFASIWFDRPGRIGSMAGLITAGLAVALGKVVTALAGYFVILRSRIFNIGDRIAMAGVRGDVIALSFLRTTILEMGQPPGEDENIPDIWIGARQYTGRIVTVTNDKVFDEPVYNYSREFPYIFEELKIGIGYEADRARAEQILRDATTRHGQPVERLAADAVAELQRRYFVAGTDLQPRVYYRLTDNWLELAVRFVTPTHGIRE